MTETEALQYAIDWLRAFPALPTAAPGYADRRAAAVDRLEAMLAKTRGEPRVTHLPMPRPQGMSAPCWRTLCGLDVRDLPPGRWAACEAAATCPSCRRAMDEVER